MLLQIESGHTSKSGFMEDFCDGKFIKAHPLFSVHTNALQVFYYDDIEVCNPLGSKAKIHKVGKYNCITGVYLSLCVCVCVCVCIS